MLQNLASPTDDSGGIIYNCNMFIVQALDGSRAAKIYLSQNFFCPTDQGQPKVKGSSDNWLISSG